MTGKDDCNEYIYNNATLEYVQGYRYGYGYGDAYKTGYSDGIALIRESEMSHQKDDSTKDRPKYDNTENITKFNYGLDYRKGYRDGYRDAYKIGHSDAIVIIREHIEYLRKYERDHPKMV